MELHVINIAADRHFITITLDGYTPAPAVLTAYLPVFGADAPVLHRSVVTAGSKLINLARVCDGQDLLTCRFVLTVDGEPVPGVRYVEDVCDPMRAFPYPEADTKKGCQISDAEDAKILGVKHSALNVNEGDFLLLEPEEGNTIEYVYNGRTFYFNKHMVEREDARIKNLSDIGVIITLILLNSPHWETKIKPEFWQIIRHPAYTDDDSEALISAFNLRTPEGVAYYSAFIAFLTDRYTREDGCFGKAYGMIVGNEVNSGYVWCNAGLQNVVDYSTEYASAVRLTWQVAASVYANMRIYLSFDHFWTDSNFGGNAPLKYYGTRPVLETLNAVLTSEGQVPWNIAFHPYPQDLNFPDFWNDTDATPDDDAKIITFKNLEVLARFTYEPAYLYRGARRRIILSEQGFNSHWTMESEVLQACAYGRAYRKVMSIPEIDSFILHA
ncbi:MAG: DUF5722 domain-containing protein, partial [Clostridia bacterium]|nr:DUF5722 domain-containing protein [Clostridia bacterium]